MTSTNFTMASSLWYDIEVSPRERKTRADILTPFAASKAHKSSKSHKLEPRKKKRDFTKTCESKMLTKTKKEARKYTHIENI